MWSDQRSRHRSEGSLAKIAFVVGVLLLALALGMTLTGCNTGRWVYEEQTHCRGGKVVLEKRVVDVTVVGRTRNTTIRTDACLD